MKITQSIMLSIVAALCVVPFTNVMASECDGYDLRKGAVFVNENRIKRDDDGNAQQNRLIVYSRDKDTGLLTEVQRAESGGYGNDASIVTSGQFSVIHSGKYVLMINAGFDPSSDSKAGSVSAFKIDKCRVSLTDVKSTVGQEPRSVTRDSRGSRDLVAVVNAGSGEAEFDGCPGLPEGFQTPLGTICGPRAPIADVEPTSYTVYKFNKRRGTFKRTAHAPTRDDNGDPAQISFINEGRQLVISQRNTFFALGDGTEDDIVEVVKLKFNGKPQRDRSGFAKALAKYLYYTNPSDIAPRFTNPVVSQTSGNDNFGFSVFPRKGKDFNDCVIMTHGSFQQRQQGGTSVFTINKHGAKVRIIPNKPDTGDDTCWTQISRTGTLYSQAFFNSEISIRGFNTETCNITDGGPPVIVVDGVPQFSGLVENIKHAISSHPATGDRGVLPTDQSDFLGQAGGLDIALSLHPGSTEYLYALNTPVPFAGFPGDSPPAQNSFGDWKYFSGDDSPNSIAIYRVIEDCAGEDTNWKKSDGSDDCRVGDLQLVGRYSGPIPGSAFGIAAY